MEIPGNSILTLEKIPRHFYETHKSLANIASSDCIVPIHLYLRGKIEQEKFGSLFPSKTFSWDCFFSLKNNKETESTIKSTEK